MGNNRKIKSVSFDLTDDLERELFSYIESKNFSKYVKQLILLDKMSGGRIIKMKILQNENKNDEDNILEL
ncbi:hypothetical protein [Ureibacillus sp. FSL K6-2830]|uniref:hypothetical protein n=1 Tax=Ureibacillus sp. FSL K6-2830 TaxID=2954610 RepID=UPI0030F927CE